jgi:hydrogenase maturation protease
MKKGRKLVIGYGNPLRGDDGLGWEIAGRLAASIADESIAIMAVHQLTPELAEPVSKAEMVIFVDASYEGQPGTWKCDKVEPAPPTADPLGHHFSIAGLLAYARAIYSASPEAFMVSVAAETFECRDALSPSVALALPQIVRYIRDKVGCPNPTLNPNHEVTHA